MDMNCQTCQRPESSIVHLLGHSYKSPKIKDAKRSPKKPKSSCKKCHQKPDAFVHLFGHSYKASM